MCITAVLVVQEGQAIFYYGGQISLVNTRFMLLIASSVYGMMLIYSENPK